MIVNACPGQPICLGYETENDVEAVVFDKSAWVAAYGPGTFEFVHKRRQDSEALPVAVDVSGGVVTWTITAADVAYRGVGECQLSFYTPDGKLKKSEIYQTVTARSLTSAEDPPSPAQGWVAEVLQAGVDAQLAQTGAEAAQAAAELAQGKAEDAQEAAERAQTAAETAQGLAEAAQTAAEDAQTAAETAQGKAEDAQEAAERAQTAAETAQGLAEAAQTAAEGAQTGAETAQGKAEDAQEAAEAAQTAAETAQAAAEAAAQTLVLDSTLTSPTQAAQAKTVGDAVDKLKSALTNITNIDIEEIVGYIANNGAIYTGDTTQAYVHTQQIKTKPGDKFHLNIQYPSSVKRWAGYALYSKTSAFISRVMLVNDTPGENYSADVVVPDGAYYIAFTYSTFGYDNVATVLQLNNLYSDVLNLEDGLTETNEKLLATSTNGTTLVAADLQQGEWINGAISTTTSRLCTKKLYNVFAGMAVNFNTSANLNIAIRVFDENGVQIEGTNWLGGTDTNETYFLRKSGRLGIFFKRTSGSYITTANYTTWGAVTNLQNSLAGITAALSETKTNYIGAPRIGKTEVVIKPMVDHLFVDSGENAVIPHESLYHVRISKRLGFNMIEANIARTSDGVFIVNHLNNGAFGTYFHHVDGTTDISSTLVSSVTWQWIVDNVRYNSTIPKYRTRPSRIEEFLGECKQQGLFPLIMVQSEEVRDIVEQYMGADNYFAYAGTRVLCPHAVISQWQKLTTKDAILKYCRGIGTPMIYCMENTNAFTETELKEIIAALHKEGFWIGTSYNDAAWYRLSNLGFDIVVTTRMINRIEHGNKYNIDSMFGFSGYTYTNATESDGVLTYTADGTLAPNVGNDVLTVGGADLQIVFDGEITVPAFGELSSLTYTRDASIPVFVTTPLIHKSPRLVLQVKAGTVIYDCTYRVMEC